MNALGSGWSLSRLWFESAEMANVVVRVADPNLERGVAGNTETLAIARGKPVLGADKLVLASTSHALHGLRSGGAECKRRGKHHPDRFLGAIGQAQAVADASTVEIDVGLRVDSDIGDARSAHFDPEDSKGSPC